MKNIIPKGHKGKIYHVLNNCLQTIVIKFKEPENKRGGKIVNPKIIS
jgi:hypothetical protein